ncbi:hypothetical protein Lalb_Chr09g0333471 [Lupinus albus]|uniref:Uncharacterized protein n=1 Tax=Lupinus albus TaxID=3870 RepID=A0A6A4Q1U9_LUPAL|nr:hypothetical protein Lalb_Chr09g0333471 [Lupinus albus]
MKDSLSPLEVGILKAAKDLEHCSLLKNKAKGVCLIAQVRESDKLQMFDVKKNNNGMCFIGAADERKKGLSIKVPLKGFLSMFSQNSDYSYVCLLSHQINLSCFLYYS